MPFSNPFRTPNNIGINPLPIATPAINTDPLTGLDLLKGVGTQLYPATGCVASSSLPFSNSGPASYNPDADAQFIPTHTESVACSTIVCIAANQMSAPLLPSFTYFELGAPNSSEAASWSLIEPMINVGILG